jgi:hypothetical protein
VDDERPAGPGWQHDGGAGGGSNVPCTEGTTKDCAITIGQHEGVLTCYEGTSTCKGGTWGECENGEVVSRPGTGSAGSPGSSAQAFGPPAPCTSNPCDPYCQAYDETPAGISDSGADHGMADQNDHGLPGV